MPLSFREKIEEFAKKLDALIQEDKEYKKNIKKFKKYKTLKYDEV